MTSPIARREMHKKLDSSEFGNFEATIRSRSNNEYYEYASVKITCVSYTFQTKLIESIQPILDELKEEMDEIIFKSENKGDEK